MGEEGRIEGRVREAGMGNEKKKGGLEGSKGSMGVGMLRGGCDGR